MKAWGLREWWPRQSMPMMRVEKENHTNFKEMRRCAQWYHVLRISRDDGVQMNELIINVTTLKLQSWLLSSMPSSLMQEYASPKATAPLPESQGYRHTTGKHHRQSAVDLVASPWVLMRSGVGNQRSTSGSKLFCPRHARGHRLSERPRGSWYAET